MLKRPVWVSENGQSIVACRCTVQVMPSADLEWWDGRDGVDRQALWWYHESCRCRGTGWLCMYCHGAGWVSQFIGHGWPHAVPCPVCATVDPVTRRVMVNLMRPRPVECAGVEA